MDVLQVDAASVTSSVEDQQQHQTKHKHHMSCIPTLSTGRRQHREAPESSEGSAKKKDIADSGGRDETKRKVEGCGCNPTVDDLRNYAYEGDGSSPGSLSSCKLQGELFCGKGKRTGVLSEK